MAEHDSATVTGGRDAAGSDVFISYARADRATAEQLAAALATHGLRVWWDRELVAGREFAEAIEAQLRSAAAVLVLWSAESVRSAFVRDESSRALRAGKLLPLRIEAVELPLGFGQTHTLELLDWNGDVEDEAFQRLLLELRRMNGAVAAPPPAPSRLGGRAQRRLAMAGGSAALLAAIAGGGWLLWQRAEDHRNAERAEQLFLRGLDSQSAKEPLLDSAFNAYLSAVQLDPGHARAHYYLGHLYAQRRQPADALDAFRLALASTRSPLDRSQRSEAEKQLRALQVAAGAAANETPVTRQVALAATGPATGDFPSAGPAVIPMPRSPRGGLEPAPGGGPAATAGSATSAGGGAGASGQAAPAPAQPGVALAPPAELFAAVRRPNPLPPSDVLVARLAPLVDALFDTDKDRRIAATSSLVIDGEALSDALPLAVARALSLLREDGTALDAAAASGLVNTLVLLQSASPASLRQQRGPLERLLPAARRVGTTTAQHAERVAVRLAQAEARRPIAYIQIANEAQRPIAERLAARFRGFGYEATGIERVPHAPEQTEVRVQGRSDRGLARWVGKATAEIGGVQPLLKPLRSVDPKTDTFEIWFERGLCAPGGRQAPDCG